MTFATAVCSVAKSFPATVCVAIPGTLLIAYDEGVSAFILDSVDHTYPAMNINTVDPVGAAKDREAAAAAAASKPKASKPKALASLQPGEIRYSTGLGLNEYSGMLPSDYSIMQELRYDPPLGPPYSDLSDLGRPTSVARSSSQAWHGFNYNNATSRQLDSRGGRLDEQWQLGREPWMRFPQFRDMLLEDNILQAVCLEEHSSFSGFAKAFLKAVITMTDHLHPREGLEREILALHPVSHGVSPHYRLESTRLLWEYPLNDLLRQMTNSPSLLTKNDPHQYTKDQGNNLGANEEIEFYDEMHSLEEAKSFLRRTHAYQRFRITMLKYVHDQRRAVDKWNESTLAIQPASIFDSVEEKMQQLKTTKSQYPYCTVFPGNWTHLNQVNFVKRMT